VARTTYDQVAVNVYLRDSMYVLRWQKTNHATAPGPGDVPTFTWRLWTSSNGAKISARFFSAKRLLSVFAKKSDRDLGTVTKQNTNARASVPHLGTFNSSVLGSYAGPTNPLAML